MKSIVTPQFTFVGALSESAEFIGKQCGEGGRYEIKAFVFKKSKVRTFEAYDKKLERSVLLKVFPRENEDFVERQLEVRRSLSHPNVSPLLDATTILGRQALVVQKIEGIRLHKLVSQEAALASTEIYFMASQILDVLVALHDLGFLHLGLEPSAIIRSTLSKYFVMSFTNVCRLNAEKIAVNPVLSGAGDCFYYSAPETHEDGVVDVRSDLFSLGALIFYAFCGRRPFAGRNRLDIAFSQKGSRPEHLSSLRPDIPLEVANWVMGLLETEPNRRPASALEALAELNELTGNFAQEAPLNFQVE